MKQYYFTGKMNFSLFIQFKLYDIKFMVIKYILKINHFLFDDFNLVLDCSFLIEIYQTVFHGHYFGGGIDFIKRHINRY